MNRNLLIFFFLSVFLTFQGLSQETLLFNKAAPDGAGMSSERFGRYHAYLKSEIEAGRLPGAVSLVIRKGRIADMNSFGYKEIESKTPMAQDQIFYIQSMTKPLISVGIMMLYEEGHFFLHDPVSKYLPQFSNLKVSKEPAAGKKGKTEAMKGQITIAHLLSHTAGFSHGLGANSLESDTRKALYFTQHADIEARVNALLSVPMIGHPGEQWYYSASPDVLALLIEKFSGMNPAVFLQQRLFDPLGMKDTGYNLSKEQQKRMTTLYDRDKEGKLSKSPRQIPMEGNTIYGGTHGMFSTAGDYMKFCQMLLNGGKFRGTQFLSRKTIELMTKNHVGDLRKEAGQGFGLGFGVLDNLAEGKMIGSEGQYYWNGAFNTHFFIDPKEELVAILMTQTNPYSNFYANKMRQFVYQAIVD